MKTLLLAAALAATSTAQAAVIDSLPYNNSPDWTVIVFAGTSMTASVGQTTMTTAEGRGVWYGWGVSYGDQPAWLLGSSSSGNHLDLTASLSPGAADWNTYLYDGSHFAMWQFAPTNCDNSCYSTPALAGVQYWYADASAPTVAKSGFVALDLAQPHRYEYLLKNGRVSYAIDGQLVYDGTALQSAFSSGLLLIGDGSGSTASGKGAMTVYANRLDTAPAAASLVPEPATAALWLAGLGLLALRRR